MYSLFAAKGQKLAREFGGAFAGDFDLLQVIVLLFAFVRSFEQEIRKTLNRGQAVIEIVCDPTSQASGRIHFLGLAKLLLDSFAFGQNACNTLNAQGLTIL